MKFAILSFGLMMISILSAAQVTDKDAMNTKGNFLAERTFKPQNPTADKTEVYDITGSRGAVFTVSNTSDGGPNSYKHSLRIVIGLIVSGTKPTPVQLVFYSGSESVPYSVSDADGMLSIYYPADVYGSIKQKLDEYIPLKKKIQLKVTVKTTGFREGSLVF